MVFVVFFIFVDVVLKEQVEKYALYESNEKLNNILINQKALHTYIEEKQKPIIYELKKEGKLYPEFFDPNILSFTYIARNIHEIENKLLKDANKTQKYYKLASMNPRNSVNSANEFERELIKRFNATNDQEYKQVVQEAGKDFLYYAKPVGKNKESCMKCHSEPDIAPVELINTYGDVKGFHERVGDIRAIVSIKIPLEKELNNAWKYYNIITIIIAFSAILVYLIIVVLMRALDKKQLILEELVNVDQLTKCYNRRSFEINIASEIELSKRTGTKFSLISFDIDHFKLINDEFGHQAGDTVLRELCVVVTSSNRTYDKTYRVGGEEFMIFLPNTGLADAMGIAQRIRLDAQKCKTRNGAVTISLGVCQYNSKDDMTAFYKKVDDALYKAKRNGRNRVESCEGV